MAASAVLLPKVFPNDMVALGQLVRNPLAPNANSYSRSCAAVTKADVSKAAPEEPYQSIVSVDTRGRFEVGLTKFLGLALNARSTSLLSIEADGLDYRALKDVSVVFKRACADDETRKWIADMVLNKAPCYFVVGIQELRNATFKRATLKSGGAGGYVTVPLEATSEVPLHIKGEIAADKFGTSKATVNGVFGIQVQKLQSKVAPSGEHGLKSDVSWHWSYQRVKGVQQEENKELHITLADAELMDMVELLRHDDEDDENDIDG